MSVKTGQAQAKLQPDKDQADSSQPSTSSGANDANGSKFHQFGETVGKLAGWVSDAIGILPGFLCGPCSAASTLFGVISGFGTWSPRTGALWPSRSSAQSSASSPLAGLNGYLYSVLIGSYNDPLQYP
jgi:hypothetical protein